MARLFDIYSDGSLGKTAKFWVFEIDLMTLQKRARASVQESDYQLRLDPYKAFITEREIPMQ